jgi:hypothetical protein
MKAGKVWGVTELLEANGVLEFHRIEAQAGGTCSKHKHKYKWNGFFVEKGKMIIRVWKKNYDLVTLISKLVDKPVTIKNILGPLGVMGRNSHNKLIKDVIGWSPTDDLETGLLKTYSWITQQITRN